MKSEEVTIVVLNWNRREETLACLRSLQAAELGGAAILVVDNGSRDGTVEAVRAEFPAVEVLALERNRGYAGGNNAGIEEALRRGAEGVLLLNNDTRVTPDFLGALLWALNDTPSAAAVCSAIHRFDRPEMLDVAYAMVRLDQRIAVQLIGVNALPGRGFDERIKVEVVVGCSVLLRAAALRQIGLLDESYFAYHEDVDWSLRARRAGWELLYEPMSRVLHRASSSTASEGPAPATASDVPVDLPNAEPLPWNPIRTYLGSRNLVRLVDTYATAEERKSFLKSCAYEIPLEFFAIVMNREGWLRLGRWTYPDIARVRFIERHSDVLARRGRVGKLLLLAVIVPVDLLWVLPREIWSAVRQHRLRQFGSYLRGLWDGLWKRPLPLRRLGLI